MEARKPDGRGYRSRCKPRTPDAATASPSWGWFVKLGAKDLGAKLWRAERDRNTMHAAALVALLCAVAWDLSGLPAAQAAWHTVVFTAGIALVLEVRVIRVRRKAAWAVTEWVCRNGDNVTIGDVVALAVVSPPHAYGRIVRPLPPEQKIECLVTQSESGSGFCIAVAEDDLLMCVEKGGGDDEGLQQDQRC